MSRFKFRSIILYFIPFIIFIYPVLGFSEASVKGTSKDEKEGSIIINSDTLEIDNVRNLVTFKGDVDARRDDLTINCETLLLYYKKKPGEDLEKGIPNIDRIVATGKVRISRPAGGLAMAEKAVYYGDEDKIVLTGRPVVRQGDDSVEGSTITLFLKDNRSVVEGSGENRARAVLFPNRDKR